MHPANHEEPAQAVGVAPDELRMGLKSFAQSFVMQGKRDLHRGKRENERGHCATPRRQIIEHPGCVPEVCDQEREAQQYGARKHDEADPFQDKTKPAHRKAEQRALPELQPLDPGQADGDQVNLDVNRAEIFKNKRESIDCGRGLEEMRRRKKMGAIQPLPINQGLD